MKSKESKTLSAEERIKMVDDHLISRGLPPTVRMHKNGSFVFIPSGKKTAKESSDKEEKKDEKS